MKSPGHLLPNPRRPLNWERPLVDRSTMASAQGLDLIVLVGSTSLMDKRFVAAMNALWFYDYFLTLADEIEWVWSGRSLAPVFVLFVLNRYWPLWYLLWLFVAFWCPEFTKPMCDKTAFFSVFYFTFATVFAQAAITLRIYAVTGNDRRIASYLSLMTSIQFIFGVYLSVLFARRPAVELPDLPFDEYQVCLFQRWRTGEIIYIVFSLAYDLSAFLIVMYSSSGRRGLAHAPGVPSLLDNIVQGATTYFLIIFSGHLLLIFFELFAPEPIQLLPASANAVLMPLMITRLVSSLKKAANVQDSFWSTSDGAQLESVRFAHRTFAGAGRGSDDIALKRLTSESIGLSRSYGRS